MADALPVIRHVVRCCSESAGSIGEPSAELSRAELSAGRARRNPTFKAGGGGEVGGGGRFLHKQK